MASIPAMAAAAYGSYPLTLIPGLMSTADQLTNAYGVMSAPPAALMKSPQRTDRLEVSKCLMSCFCLLIVICGVRSAESFFEETAKDPTQTVALLILLNMFRSMLREMDLSLFAWTS